MIRINQKDYHPEANFRYIYGNPDGYVVPDSTKGGYLIRATKKILSNSKISFELTLDEIVNKIRRETNSLAGKAAVSCVQDVSTMMYPVKFKIGTL